MKKFLKWYVATWKKKDIDGLDCIEMCWASLFVILVAAGIFILAALTHNAWRHLQLTQ